MNHETIKLIVEACAKECDELAELNRIAPTDSMWQWGECADAIKKMLPSLIEKYGKHQKLMEDAIMAMAEDGWLFFGVEGMSEAQQKCYDAYLLLNPIDKEIANDKDK